MKYALYVGLDAPKRHDVNVIHIPLIKIAPKPPHELKTQFEKLNKATHIIVTSKSTVAIAKEHFQLHPAQFISVGSATTKQLLAIGIQNILTAKNECQEGIIQLIEELQPKSPFFFWPHSSLSRPILSQYFTQKNYSYIECSLYDTHFLTPEVNIDLQTINEIHFTSPSTVEAFFAHFGRPPAHITLHTIGPITKDRLIQCIKL